MYYAIPGSEQIIPMLKVQHIAKETSAFVVLHYRYMFCSAKTAFFPGWSNYVRQAFHLLLPHWLNGCNQSWKKQYSFHLQYIYVLCSAALRSRRFFPQKLPHRPSVLALEHDLIPVMFPECRLFFFASYWFIIVYTSSSSCIFPLSPYVKVVLLLQDQQLLTWSFSPGILF